MRIQGDRITLDFSVDEFEEYFAPTPSENIVHFDILSLKNAIESAKTELDVFARRLEKINLDESLNIDNISELLIWNKGNHE